MSELSTSELRRFAPPHASAAEEKEAFEFWSAASVAEKLAATMQLTVAFYRWRGIDPDASHKKTLRIVDRNDEAHQLEEQLADEENERLWKLFKETN